MKKKDFLYPDAPLGPQLRPVSEAFSAITVIKEMWFPHLLTDKEREQIAKRSSSVRQGQ